MTTCKNCGQEFEGNYCNSCGQTAKTQRLNWAFILHNVEHDVLHFDRGIIYTIREIFLSPGKTIKNFIEGKRKKYTHPLTYLVVISVIYYILRGILLPHGEIAYSSDADKTISEFIYNYYSKIVMVIIVPLAALCTPVFYMGQPYNFVELFTFHCYMRGQFMLFELIVISLNWILVQLHVHLYPLVLAAINVIFNILFLAWSLKQFYNRDNLGVSLLKAIGLMALLIMSSLILTRIATLILTGK